MTGDGLNGPNSLCLLGANLWVTNLFGDSVTELNARSGALVRVIQSPKDHFSAPTGIAGRSSHVWVTNQWSNTVTELDASTAPSKGLSIEHLSSESSPFLLDGSRTVFRDGLQGVEKPGVAQREAYLTSMDDVLAPSARPQLALRGGRADAPLSERVYVALRDSILAGLFDEDAQLIQESIADELEISRTPVREALFRLASEGYVRQNSGRGFFVASASPTDLAEIFQIRAILETEALQLGFDHFTATHLQNLRDLQRATYEPEWVRAAYNESNRRFHFALCEPCPNRTLVGLIHDLWERPAMQLLTHKRAATLRDPETWREEHEPLIRAIETGERERALDLLARHLAIAPTTQV